MKKTTKQSQEVIKPKRIVFDTFLKKYMNDPQIFDLEKTMKKEAPKNADRNCLWTVIEVEGRYTIINGWSYVNRVGYIVSKKPHNNEYIDVIHVCTYVEKAPKKGK